MKLKDAIQTLKKERTERKFTQTVDVIVNLKNIDMKKPENKFALDVALPHGSGKNIKVCFISDTFKDALSKTDMEDIAKNKKKAKTLSKDYDFFVCEAPLMPVVGKLLGKYLAPKGKMPQVLAPNADSTALVERLSHSVRLRLRDAPSISTRIAKENDDESHIEENVLAVIEALKKRLPKGENQIKNIMLKLTMSKPVKVDVN